MCCLFSWSDFVVAVLLCDELFFLRFWQEVVKTTILCQLWVASAQLYTTTPSHFIYSHRSRLPTFVIIHWIKKARNLNFLTPHRASHPLFYLRQRVIRRCPFVFVNWFEPCEHARPWQKNVLSLPRNALWFVQLSKQKTIILDTATSPNYYSFTCWGILHTLVKWNV